MRAEIIETTAASFRTGLRWGVMGALLAVLLTLLVMATASPGGMPAERTGGWGEVLTKVSGR